MMVYEYGMVLNVFFGLGIPCIIETRCTIYVCTKG